MHLQPRSEGILVEPLATMTGTHPGGGIAAPCDSKFGEGLLGTVGSDVLRTVAYSMLATDTERILIVKRDSAIRPK